VGFDIKTPAWLIIQLEPQSQRINLTVVDEFSDDGNSDPQTGARVSLSATPQITEDGGTITYTANLNEVPATDVLVTLDNGEQITISAGETSGTVEVNIAEAEFEDVYIECPDKFSGVVIEKMGIRKGDMKDMKVEGALATMNFLISTRGLIGYRAEFITDTRGEGILSTLFHGYLPYLGDLHLQYHGSLIAHEAGVSTHYGLAAAQGRGVMFIEPGVSVYEGMIVGKNSRADDIEVNVCKGKKLTNMRASGSDAREVLHVAKKMSLEESVEYLSDDELLEVTPKNLRLRKKYLSKNDRKRAKR